MMFIFDHSLVSRDKYKESFRKNRFNARFFVMNKAIYDKKKPVWSRELISEKQGIFFAKVLWNCAFASSR